MFDSTVNSISDPLTQYWDEFVAYIPQLIGALVVLIIGLIVASIIGSIVKAVLKLLEENNQVKSFLKHWDIKLRLSKFVSKFAWWVVFLVFLGAVVQILEVNALTATLNSLVGYLPQLFAGVIVAVFAFVGAKVVRGLVHDVLDGINFKETRFISNVTYAVVLVFGLTLAATQLGLDMSLVTANITVIVAGVMLALALAFGLGGREVAGKMLNELYEGKKAKKRK